ncbi:MAG: hypothetical protein LBR33_09885, partial [Propionibacteriaceae bacterium]|nr:hypothetical protein [Propionibacteriaceae bacterium]
MPQAADRYPREPDPDQPFSFHDDAGRRWLDLGTGRGPERRDHLARYREDEDGEQLRVLYVALTRAACHVTAWWVPTKFNTAASALHRILGAERGQPVPAAVPVDGHSPVAQRLPDGVAVELMDPLDQ